MFDIKNYYKARSVADAIDYLGKHPEARCLAGGTDVLVRLRELHPGYEHLVCIRDLPELKPIEILPDSTLRIGAGATFDDIMESNAVAVCAPLLAEAAASVAGPQIRNVGTIGGNLCNGAVSADTAAPVLAMDANLRLAGPEGERVIPALGFHTGPGKVALKPGEIMLSVDVPAQSWQGFGGRYIKYAMREAMDIATIGCAASIRIEDGVISGARLAYAVAAPTPIRCANAEAALMGKKFGPEAIDEAQKAVEADVKPRTSWRATAEFRMHIIKTLLRRTLRDAAL